MAGKIETKESAVPQSQAIDEALDRNGRLYNKANGGGQVLAVQNPLKRPIHVVAPWGEVQHGAADCVIADSYDPAKKRRAGRPYVVARAEFDANYKSGPASSSTPWYRR